MIRNLRTLLNGLRNVRSRVFRLAVECLRLAQRLDWPSPGVQAPPITVDRPLRRYFPPSRVSANWRNSEIRGRAVPQAGRPGLLWWATSSFFVCGRCPPLPTGSWASLRRPKGPSAVRFSCRPGFHFLAAIFPDVGGFREKRRGPRPFRCLDVFGACD
jgi:hypothetical protein